MTVGTDLRKYYFSLLYAGSLLLHHLILNDFFQFGQHLYIDHCSIRSVMLLSYRYELSVAASKCIAKYGGAIVKV